MATYWYNQQFIPVNLFQIHGIFSYLFLNTSFSIANINQIPIPSILLPIGVSFIVFEKITYLVDVYRGDGKPAPNLGRYLLYVFFFPKLLAGPIIKYHDIADQLKNRSVTIDDASRGLNRFAIGLAKKVILADTLGRFADIVFRQSPPEIGFSSAWIGLLCFTLQIYFDFSGYSDMAIGIARIFGFRLMENFNHPYIAENFTDFWRRWHICLSTWIRQYLYIPLGGNRISVARTYVNLSICFFLSGLWHGARWTFVVWGLYQGLFLVIDRLFWIRVSARLPRALRITACFLFVMLGWVVFRAQSLTHALTYFHALMLPQQVGGFYLVKADVYAAMIIGLFLSFAPFLRKVSLLSPTPENNFTTNAPLPAWQLISGALLFFFSIMRATNSTFNPFLYFRF